MNGKRDVEWDVKRERRERNGEGTHQVNNNRGPSDKGEGPGVVNAGAL
jgi:hypothetical protein